MPGCRSTTVCGQEVTLTLRCNGTVVDTLVLSHCGNRQCDERCGETPQNCPADCALDTCGVNGCEDDKGENAENCFRDCGEVDLTINGQGVGQRSPPIDVSPNTDFTVGWDIKAPSNVQCTFTRNGDPWPPHPPPPMNGSRVDRFDMPCGGGRSCGDPCLECRVLRNEQTNEIIYAEKTYTLSCSVPGQGSKNDTIIARTPERYCKWICGGGSQSLDLGYRPERFGANHQQP